MKYFHIFLTVFSISIINASSMAAVITVNSSAGGTVSGKCTLEDAVKAANTNAVVASCLAGQSAVTDEIRFNLLAGIHTIPIEQTIVIEEAVSIYGTDDPTLINSSAQNITETIVDVSSASLSNGQPKAPVIFDIGGPQAINVGHVTLRNLGITGGQIAINYRANTNKLTVKNCDIHDNHQTSYSYVNGQYFEGIIHSRGPRFEFVNSVARKNITTQSAGLAIIMLDGYSATSLTTALISESSIHSNTGIGLYFFEMGNAQVVHTTISDNRPLPAPSAYKKSSSGVAYYNSFAQIYFSTITRNEGRNDGNWDGIFDGHGIFIGEHDNSPSPTLFPNGQGLYLYASIVAGNGIGVNGEDDISTATYPGAPTPNPYANALKRIDVSGSGGTKGGNVFGKITPNLNYTLGANDVHLLSTSFPILRLDQKQVGKHKYYEPGRSKDSNNMWVYGPAVDRCACQLPGYPTTFPPVNPFSDQVSYPLNPIGSAVPRRQDASLTTFLSPPIHPDACDSGSVEAVINSITSLDIKNSATATPVVDTKKSRAVFGWSNAPSLRIFPNPISTETSDLYVEIDSDKTDESVKYQISNMHGQMVAKGQAEHDSRNSKAVVVIELPDQLAAGLYMLRIYTETFARTGKITIH